MSSSSTTTPPTSNHPTEIRSLATHKPASFSYYVFVTIFAAGSFYFFLTRLVELVDSSFINPFNFPMMLVSYLAVGSFFITPPKTMALLARRFGLTLMVRIENSL
jgi:hypothetical protein